MIFAHKLLGMVLTIGALTYLALSYPSLSLIAIMTLVGIVALTLTSLLMPGFIRRIRDRGLTEPDINKLDKNIRVPLMGGLVVNIGFSAGILFAIFLHTYAGIPSGLAVISIMAGFLTIMLCAFLGIIDDLFGWKNGITQWQHALIPIFAALPLVVIAAGTTSMDVPLFGVINLGIWYSIILVPLGVAGASNLTNMLEGLNGLGASLGTVITLTLLIIGILLGRYEIVILMAALLGALVAFLRFNWTPAQIFPGDALTLMMGAAFATVAIIGNIESFTILLMSLYIIEFFIKAKHRFKSNCFGIPQKDGTLHAPERTGSLTHVFMRLGKPTSESGVVTRIVLAQAIISILVLAYFYYLHYILPYTI